VWIEADVTQEKGTGTEPKIVTFETADRSGGPFKDVISKYGLPSKKFRHCTRELKEVPIHKYAKKVLGKDYLTAVGIRADEPHRLGKKPNYIYPLAEMGFTEEIIEKVEEALPSAFDINYVFSTWNLGVDFLRTVLKVPEHLLSKPETSAANQAAFSGRNAWPIALRLVSTSLRLCRRR
jgi:hypothetical protein